MSELEQFEAQKRDAIAKLRAREDYDPERKLTITEAAGILDELDMPTHRNTIHNMIKRGTLKADIHFVYLILMVDLEIIINNKNLRGGQRKDHDK